MTSLPVRSIQNLIILSSLPIMKMYSKFEGNRTIFAEITNMTLLVHFYIAQILPEPAVVRLSVYHIKNSPWFHLSKALTFIPIGSLVAKIKLYRQFRVLCVYFRNRKCYNKNSKNHIYYLQVIHPVQISAL